MENIQQLIEHAWEKRTSLTPATASRPLIEALNLVLDGLENGSYQVCEKKEGRWTINTWLKQAILLYFKATASTIMGNGLSQFFDKIPLQFKDAEASDFTKDNRRIVPQALVRRGAHIGANTVLMPSYVNIGAHVGAGTMVDTWATVGSCAYIGEHVHLSGGVGIGGVLEPLQATPTIIEDRCFIGARSEIVEGFIVESGAVIGMGVYLGQSTRIYDRVNKTFYRGRIPANAVVVPGSLPSESGEYSLSAAIIVKYADEQTRAKVGINEILREACQA